MCVCVYVCMCVFMIDGREWLSSTLDQGWPLRCPPSSHPASTFRLHSPQVSPTLAPTDHLTPTTAAATHKPFTYSIRAHHSSISFSSCRQSALRRQHTAGWHAGVPKGGRGVVKGAHLMLYDRVCVAALSYASVCTQLGLARHSPCCVQRLDGLRNARPAARSVPQQA